MNNYLKTIESAKEFINQSIEQGVSPEDVAKAANYSLKQLNRIFLLSIGITVSEYIRWNKLTKALFELKFNDTPIIDIAMKYGYDSQDGFARAFKDNFSVTLGEYRKTRQGITAKNWHINEFIHQEAHNAFSDGLREIRGSVESWTVVKPDRIWACMRRNTENLPGPRFIHRCVEDGTMERTAALPGVIGEAYVAYFPANDDSGVCWGAELEENYPLDLLKEFEVIRIPQCKYIVFCSSPYSPEAHGDAIFSVWNAQYMYNIEEQGLVWAFDKAPVFEEDNEDTGYTLWFPVAPIEEYDADSGSKDALQNLPVSPLTYRFNEMTLNKNQGVSSYSISPGGALSVNYGGRYKEIKFSLPNSVNLAAYNTITVNGISEEGQTAIKICKASIPWVQNNVFAMYNNKSSTASDWTYTLRPRDKSQTIQTIGIMSQSTGDYSATIYSITFS